MADADREARFNAGLSARVYAWRNERGWTAEQMAIAPGIPADRYRKYEKRSPMPVYLLEQFATICERDVVELLTGRAPARPQARKIARLSRVPD